MTAHQRLALGLSTCLLVWGLAFAASARAELQFRMGIYAYDDPNEVIWSCPAVQDALARRMTALLDEDVEIDVLLEDDYDRGVSDLTGGHIDVARFPNVENYWVIHPGLELDIADAWRTAMIELRLEEIVPDILRELGVADIQSVPGEIGNATLERVEDQFGACLDVINRFGKSQNPASERLFTRVPAMLSGYTRGLLETLAAAHRQREVGALNQLPATAAGGQPPASDCACPK